MDDNTIQQPIQTAPVAPAAPAYSRVRCITELKPWANVIGDNGAPTLRPLDIDEVVSVPVGEAQVLQNHRHAIIVG